jgi:hypothetical protein
MSEKHPKVSEKKDLTNKEILRIYNNHVADCGMPPCFTNRDDTTSKRGNYYGYFENRYGEQMIFVYEYEAERGFVWSGDCGWKTKIEVAEIELAGMIEQAQKDLPEKSVEDIKAFLLGDHPIPSSHRLKNGNYLYPHAMNFNQSEMAWLKSCWETVRHYFSVRQKKKT